MDFSSVPRALESLQRRRPPLTDEFLEIAAKLLKSREEESSLVFCEQLTKLLHCADDSPAAEQDEDSRPRWEPLAVGLFVATEVLSQQIPRLEQETTQQQQGDLTSAAGKGVVYMDGPRVPSIDTPTESTQMPNETYAVNFPAASNLSPTLEDDQVLALCETLHPIALDHLEDSEPRVRTLVAKAAGVYCKATLLLKQGESLRKTVHARVLSSIQQHLAQGRNNAEQRDSNYSKSSTGALDDTTGWRPLETNWQCLAAIISAMGSSYYDDFGVFPEELLHHCQHSCIVHVNRHVRAAGMAVLEQCIAAAVCSPAHSACLLADTQSGFSKTMIAVLRDGLADNWSQVRMAASVLCRAYLTVLQNLQVDLTPLFPALLPRMCLNRFYLAQGVKLYSHETWRIFFQNQEKSGIGRVVQHLPAVCRYYVKMCDADNHVVREAACQAIAELAVRLGDHEDYNTRLQPHVDMLLQALLMCFHDESWPVRDEACLACGILCRSYPEECHPELNTLWERWSEQLTDQIWSIREDAAVALGDALDAYGVELFQKIKVLLKELLPSAKNQPAMTMAEYKARQNDAAAHTDSQLFSCGSLAPKLHKRKEGAGRIGCSSCDVTRERQLWEATDGCIYLVRELVTRCCNTGDGAPVTLSNVEIKEILLELADVCRVRHFPQADDLRATFWRQVPIMAKAIGKQRFKRDGYLEIFVDLLFSNLDSRSSTSQLCQHAAGQCAEELSEFMGVAIFRGRLEDDYQREIFDRVMQERRAMPKGPASVMDGGAAFSPFGPPGLLGDMGAKGPAAVFPGRV